MRMGERVGGVCFEQETIALSPEIPEAFRAVVRPIVRRDARVPLLTCLQETMNPACKTGKATSTDEGCKRSR